jgi:hypothetical protein
MYLTSWTQQRPGELTRPLRRASTRLERGCQNGNCAVDGAVLATSTGPRASRVGAPSHQPRQANWRIPRAIASGEEHSVGFERARLQMQQPRRGEALLLSVVIVAAAVAAAVRTAAWANSSIRLQIVDDVVGQAARREPEHRLVGAMPAAAPRCSSAPRATFTNEFATLSRAIGNDVGQPTECAHVDPATGDVLQATSTGLAVYRAGSHLAIFTDGYRHWALDRQGLVTWEGDAVDPPE